jgi:protein-tyrosine phosphatase
VPGELVADCFALAVEVRELDMRASPYDLRDRGYEPVPVETPEGKAAYVVAQRGFAERAAPLRQRLVDVCDALLASWLTDHTGDSRRPPRPPSPSRRLAVPRAPYRRGVTSTSPDDLRTGRWLRLDGTTNTRDLGGLPTSDGGTTAFGRVLRSDNLQTLSDDDVRCLVEDLRLRDVIDLRTTAEVLLEGRGPLRGVEGVTHRHFSLLPERGHHTDVFAAEEDELPELPAGWAETVLPRQTTEADEVEPPAVRSYLGYLHHRPDNVLAALRAVATGDGAAVVHCAAGKDRTGVVAMFTLAAAGVPDEEIVADYAMTADVIDALVAKLRQSPTYAEDMTRREVAVHTPRAETMRRLLEILRERHGGPLGWLEENGFGAREQAALRARLRD